MAQDREVRDLERRRKAAANNSAAVFGRLGAIPDDGTLSLIRIELIIDHLFGQMEMDEDGGYVGGSLERLKFETSAIEGLLAWAVDKEGEVKETFRQAKVGGLIVPR